MSEIEKLLRTLLEKHDLDSKSVKNNTNKFGELKNLPNDYLEFMNLTDGLDLCVGCIMSEKDILEDDKNWKPEFFNAFGDSPVGSNNKAENFTLFASDGMGGYYAFSTKQGDETVYYFDHENVEDVETFENFACYLQYCIDLFD